MHRSPLRLPSIARAPLSHLTALLAAQMCWLPVMAQTASDAEETQLAAPPVVPARAAPKSQGTLPTTEVRARADAPPATVIERERLEQEPPKNIGTLFDNEPGVDFSNARAGQLGDIEIRGMGGMGNFMGVGSNRVTIELDGMEIGQNFNFGHNMTFGRQYFDAGDLKQVDIHKGPGAYGLAGSVQFRTKDPVDYLLPGQRFGGEVRGGYSGDNRDIGAGLSLAALLNEQQSISLSYNRHNYHELKNKGSLDVDGSDRTRNNPIDGHSNSINTKWVMLAGANHKFTVGLQYFDNHNEINQRSGLGPSRGGIQTHASRGVQTSERKALSLRHDLGVVTPVFDGMSWQLSVQRTNSEGLNTTVRSRAGGAQQISHDNNYFNIRSVSLRSDFDKTLSPASESSIGHTLHYGLRLAHSEFDQGAVRISARGVNERNYFPKNKQWQAMLHVADRIQFRTSGVSVVPSLNLIHISVDPKLPAGTTPAPGTRKYSKTSLGGGLRLEWQLNPQHLLSASLQHAVRMPGYGETNGQSYGHWLGRPNPDLKPESSNGFELAWSSQGAIGKQVTTLFYDEYKDMLEVDCGPNYSATHCEVRNAQGNTQRYGLEFKGQLQLAQLGGPERMMLESGFIYTKGNTGEPGARKPSALVNPFNGFVGVRYGQAQDIWSVSARVKFSAAKRESDLPKDIKPLPGYGTIDLVGHYRPMKNLLLSGGIYNVTDKVYARWSRARGYNGDSYASYHEAGRYVGINLRYQF